MKGSFQMNSVNLDSGILKEGFSQESLATSIEGNLNAVSHSLDHLHFPQSILYALCSKQKRLAV